MSKLLNIFILIVTVIVGVTLWFLIIVNHQKSDLSWIVYKDPDNRFELLYPDNWIVKNLERFEKGIEVESKSISFYPQNTDYPTYYFSISWESGDLIDCASLCRLPDINTTESYDEHYVFTKQNEVFDIVFPTAQENENILNPQENNVLAHKMLDSLEF